MKQYLPIRQPLCLGLFAFFALLGPEVVYPSPFTPATIARPGKDYALLFAVSDYTELDDLTFPIRNAEDIAQELRDRYGFSTEVVKNPTLDQIYEKINAYRKKAYAQDAQLLVFFSGHGNYDKETKIGFFAPHDARQSDYTRRSYFEYPILTREVYSIPCNHILLALDACYSGSLDERLNPKGGGFGVRPDDNQASQVDLFVQDKLKYKSRLCITSGLLEETSDNSEFAARLLIALRTNSNPVMTFDGLNAVLEFARPKPHHARLDGDEGGDFVFVPAQNTGIALGQASSNETVSFSEKIVGKWRENRLSGVDYYDFDFTYGGAMTSTRFRFVPGTGRAGHEQEQRIRSIPTNYYGSWVCNDNELVLNYQVKQGQATEGPMITEHFSISFQGNELWLTESTTGKIHRFTRSKE